jgi:hypothetical protein
MSAPFAVGDRLKLTLDDRQGKRRTAACEITRVVALKSDGAFRVECVRPGRGEKFAVVAAICDRKGVVQPEPQW